MMEGKIDSILTLKKSFSKETLELDAELVKIQEKSDNVLAIHYKAPMYKTVELEMFLDNLNQIETLTLDIGHTGELNVRYRGLIDAKDDFLPNYYDHKILLLQESKCPKKEDLKNIKPTSKFIPNYTISKQHRKKFN